MRNETGEPFVFKDLDEDNKFWKIYFNPGLRLDGFFYYRQISGFFDEQDAETLVNIIERNQHLFDR